MRNKRKVRVISNLICPECGLNFPLPRTHGKKERMDILKMYIVRNAIKCRNLKSINIIKVIERWMEKS